MRKLTPNEETRQNIIDNGCYERERNTRIYDKWFRNGPRGRIQALIRRYNLTQKAVLDIGCGYGNNLIFYGPGSYGFEYRDKSAAFARSIGLTAHTRDLIEDDLTDLPKVDVVMCYAVIEHVESPHVALRKIHALLKPEGLAIIYVPTIPALPLLGKLPRIGGHFTGHGNIDHINAFTPATIRFMVERAGFRDLEYTTALPGIGRLLDIPPLHSLIDGAVIVGRKDDAWQYPEASTRTRTESGRGFTYKEYFSK
jgi:SAM-dependent methyltransferase